MKILHLISSGGFYGAESVITALSREQTQRYGHVVQVGVFENEHAPANHVADEFEARGVHVVRIPCRRRIDLRTIGELRRSIYREGFDLLHTHGYKADICGYLAARRMSVPLLATSHHWTGQTRAVRFYEFLDGLFLRSFDAVVAVSEKIAHELCHAGVPKDKITIIDNGIDLSRYNTMVSERRRRDQLLIGTAGRLVEQKGMKYFLRAAQQLLKEFPDLLFVIVGDGPDRDALEQLAKELQIEKSVCFMGSHSDMASVYASLDIFVLASIAEGMPMAALEAMASGLPVVATNVGAMSKLIISAKTGMLVQPTNVDELAEALVRLLRDPELRKRVARNGKQRVHERFSSGIMAQNYEKIYGQLMTRNSRALGAVSVADQGA